MQEAGDVRDHRSQLERVRERLVARALERHGIALVEMDEHEVVQLEQGRELGREAVRIEEILHAQGAPRDLVLVRGADAAPGGADLSRTHRGLARLIEGDVHR